MKRFTLTFLILLLLAGPAMAGKYDIELDPNLDNDTFGEFIQEAGFVAAYRSLAPAEPQGLTGFDIGLAATMVDIDSSTWDLVLQQGATDPPGYLAVPKIQVRKGLPFLPVDVGAMYATVPDSNLELFGGEVQIALLEGGVATPALSVRGSYSTLEGVDDLDLETYAADLVISKGFLMFTPYAGVGTVHTTGEYAGTDPALLTTLKKQDFDDTRYFGGLRMSMALLRLTLDAEYLETPVYSMKLSLGF